MNNIPLEISETDVPKRTFTCVLTKEIVDRDGEVILLDGLDLEAYKANPVVMFAHGKDKNAGKIPVGKMVNIRRVNGHILGDGEMASRPDAHPEAEEWVPDTLLSLMQQKCLNAVSIGFVPIAGRRANADDMKKYGAKCEMVTTKSELVELSLEPTPCNSSALIIAVSKGFLPKKSKAWDGEVSTDAPAPKAKTIVELKPRKKHVVILRKSDEERIAEKAIVRVKGGLYA